MRPRDLDRARRLEQALLTFDRNIRPLSGIRDSGMREVFLEQLLESIHRVRFVEALRQRPLSSHRTDPNDELFDPLKAAIVHQRQGNVEEAFWLVFLFVHFGKHSRTGWRYAREVYGCLGDARRWDWPTTSTDPSAFRRWLADHERELERIPGGFGNHRKYESLRDTGDTIESYIAWVSPPRTHHEIIQQACLEVRGDRRKAFDYLYRSMNVHRFGRMARFDYLTMIGKMNLAPIEPGSTYLQGSTGPLKGARLLFGTDASTAKLDQWLGDLEPHLRTGMQVLEDALCNWQKSPGRFVPFRG